MWNQISWLFDIVVDEILVYYRNPHQRHLVKWWELKLHYTYLIIEIFSLVEVDGTPQSDGSRFCLSITVPLSVGWNASQSVASSSHGLFEGYDASSCYSCFRWCRASFPPKDVVEYLTSNLYACCLLSVNEESYHQKAWPLRENVNQHHLSPLV